MGDAIYWKGYIGVIADYINSDRDVDGIDRAVSRLLQNSTKSSGCAAINAGGLICNTKSDCKKCLWSVTAMREYIAEHGYEDE